MAAAKATADKIAAATHDAESFTAAVTANVPAKTSEDGTSTAPSVTDNANTKGSNFSSAVYADWLYSADRHCQRRDRRGAGKQRLLRRALREPR